MELVTVATNTHWIHSTSQIMCMKYWYSSLRWYAKSTLCGNLHFYISWSNQPHARTFPCSYPKLDHVLHVGIKYIFFTAQTCHVFFLLGEVSMFFFFKDFVIDIVDSPKCRAACSAPIRVIVGKICCTFWCQKLKEEFHTKRLTHCQKLAVSYKDRTEAVKLKERFPELSGWPANWALDCMPLHMQ